MGHQCNLRANNVAVLSAAAARQQLKRLAILAGQSAGGHLAALVSQQAQMPPFSLEYAPQ